MTKDVFIYSNFCLLIPFDSYLLFERDYEADKKLFG